MNLEKRLVFYNIGFDGGDEPFDEAGKDGKVARTRLAERLDRIPISLKISGPDRLAIDKAVALTVNERNPCLRAIRDIVAGKETDAEAARRICRETEPQAARK